MCCDVLLSSKQGFRLTRLFAKTSSFPHKHCFNKTQVEAVTQLKRCHERAKPKDLKKALTLTLTNQAENALFAVYTSTLQTEFLKYLHTGLSFPKETFKTDLKQHLRVVKRPKSMKKVCVLPSLH